MGLARHEGIHVESAATMQKIVVNGKEYASVEEMPPDVRRTFEATMSTLKDADGNGIPDLVEQGGIGVQTTKIELTGGLKDVSGMLQGSFTVAPQRLVTMGLVAVIVVLLAIIAALLAVMLPSQLR